MIQEGEKQVIPGKHKRNPVGAAGGMLLATVLIPFYPFAVWIDATCNGRSTSKAIEENWKAWNDLILESLRKL